MCGIAGILNKEKKVDGTVLNRMSKAIMHRGPDAHGIFLQDKTGFIHRRLFVIDIEYGNQPMFDATGRFVIVYNGEIYNYIELKKELIEAGFCFKTNSDTEVLLNLYIKEGTDCFKKLIGMFSFAIYDTKTKKTILARDRFGIKPLYYTEFPDGIAFASEIKALLKHPKIAASPDTDGLYEYITFQFCLGEKTLFRGIKSLEPASYLVIQDGCIIKKAKYWQADFTIDARHKEEYFLRRLDYLIEDSVRLQLRSDVSLGAYLSGGVDSSTVTCYASRLLNKPIATFSGGFKGFLEFDETRYAAIVSKYAKTQHFEVFPSARDFVGSIKKLVYFMDQPAAGPGLFPQYFVSKLAAGQVKVVLGGQGGDEVFGGYARYLIAYLEQCIKAAIFQKQEEGKFVVRLDTVIGNLSALKEYIPLIKSFWSGGVFEPMDRRYFKLINRFDGDSGLYSASFLKDYNQEKVFQKFSGLFNSPQTKSYFNKMTYFDLRFLLPALLQVEDRMSMAVSVESRVPLLDHRIVELIASVPPVLKFKDGQIKYLFRKAVKSKVPKEIINRKDKMGFPVPLSAWLKKGIVREFVLDTLLSNKARKRGIFNQKKIECAVSSEESFGRLLWGALNIELWFNNFID